MFDGATEGQQKHLEIIATKEQYAKAEVKTWRKQPKAATLSTIPREECANLASRTGSLWTDWERWCVFRYSFSVVKAESLPPSFTLSCPHKRRPRLPTVPRDADSVNSCQVNGCRAVTFCVLYLKAETPAVRLILGNLLPVFSGRMTGSESADWPHCRVTQYRW